VIAKALAKVESGAPLVDDKDTSIKRTVEVIDRHREEGSTRRETVS
jgi:hypothetical protein